MVETDGRVKEGYLRVLFLFARRGRWSIKFLVGHWPGWAMGNVLVWDARWAGLGVGIEGINGQ